MPKVLVIQNIDCEPLGSFAEADAEFKYVKPFAEEAVPEALDDWDALIVLGGPMAVYEADGNPFLLDEIQLLRLAIAHDFPVLGICLGSQLIAAAAGALVYPGPEREVGWSEVELTDAARSDILFSSLPDPLPVFQLHGDTFELAENAVRLATNRMYTNQAFRLGQNVYGLQFHLEITTGLAADWASIYGDYIAETGMDPGEILENPATMYKVLLEASEDLINRFLLLC